MRIFVINPNTSESVTEHADVESIGVDNEEGG